MRSPIKILPYHHFNQSEDIVEKNILPNNYWDKKAYFYSCAKEAIHRILVAENLTRKDEVFISTTSDSNFVSSCVTSTIFNYAKVSRVLTNNTKLIFVIHEFGFPNTKIEEYSLLAKKNNIPLVEDAAHVIGTKYKGMPLGNWGDYLIHSIPKTLPLKTGGILVTNKKNRVFEENNYQTIKENYTKMFSIISNLNNTRRKMFKFYEKKFMPFDKIYDLTQGTAPFVFGFFSHRYLRIYDFLENDLNIELIRTYNKNWVTIPLNPFHSEAEMEFIVKSIKKQI